MTSKKSKCKGKYNGNSKGEDEIQGFFAALRMTTC
jgi:hypothetical protein